MEFTDRLNALRQEYEIRGVQEGVDLIDDTLAYIDDKLRDAGEWDDIQKRELAHVDD